MNRTYDPDEPISQTDIYGINRDIRSELYDIRGYREGVLTFQDLRRRFPQELITIRRAIERRWEILQMCVAQWGVDWAMQRVLQRDKIRNPATNKISRLGKPTEVGQKDRWWETNEASDGDNVHRTTRTGETRNKQVRFIDDDDENSDYGQLSEPDKSLEAERYGYHSGSHRRNAGGQKGAPHTIFEGTQRTYTSGTQRGPSAEPLETHTGILLHNGEFRGIRARLTRAPVPSAVPPTRKSRGRKRASQPVQHTSGTKKRRSKGLKRLRKQSEQDDDDDGYESESANRGENLAETSRRGLVEYSSSEG